MKAIQAVAAFGVVLILVGGVLEPLGYGVMSGMFGIWGITAIAASVFVYAALWLNKSLERRAASRVEH